MHKWWIHIPALLMLVLIPAVARAQFPPTHQPNEPTPLSATPNPTVENIPAAPPPILTDDGSPNAFGDRDCPCPEDPLLFWIRGEYLNFRLSQDRTDVVLVTTSTSPDATTNFGAIGQSATVPLFGPSNLNQGQVGGGRFTVGVNIPKFLPVEVGGFWLSGSQTYFEAASDSGGAPLLARPVRATQVPGETVFLVSFPGIAAGNVAVTGQLDLWGVEANVVLPIGASDVLAVEGLIGVRTLILNEDLRISDSLTPLNGNSFAFNGNPAGVATGDTVSVVDRFKGENNFIGGQIGLRTHLDIGRLSLGINGKLAVGQTRQVLLVEGSSTLTTTTGPTRVDTITVPGGILALPSNSGRFGNSTITFIPELGLTAVLQISRSLYLQAGFDIFYWSSVIRPGKQVNNQIDTRQSPTSQLFDPTVRASQPAPFFERSDFYGYGLSVGVVLGF